MARVSGEIDPVVRLSLDQQVYVPSEMTRGVNNEQRTITEMVMGLWEQP